MTRVAVDGTFAQWRDQARNLLRRGVKPESVFWVGGESAETLFPDGGETEAALVAAPQVGVPKVFLEAARYAACHRDATRWGLLYRVAYRIWQGERHLMEVASDADVNRLMAMEKAVRRDMHKMRAFVRFRQVEDNFIAWHRPDHHIVEENAPFFVRRFGSMRWAILTPEKSAFWDTEQLRFGPGVPRSQAPAGDDLESLWLTYYASIFNPARVKVKAMKAEMPVRHWATLPETALVPELLLHAGGRVEEMAARQPKSAQAFVPVSDDLVVLREAAKRCEGCDLFRHATQTVFGEGIPRARVVFVGEQPGDQEDLAGKPFVGPAGKMFDRALAEAGVARNDTYVTNAVKHFKFVERGKRRIHDKPSGAEIAACRPWLEAEVRAIRPQLVVCLGATAGQSVMGRAVKVGAERGRIAAHHWAPGVLLTIHPSFLLRIPEPEKQEEEYRRFVEDLKQVRESLNPV